MRITEISLDGISVVRNIALATWPDTFKDILSPKQIAYMLEWMYNESSLKKQIEEGCRFFVAEYENQSIGFVAIQHGYKETNKTKVHKIYLLPEAQGKGVGKALLAHAEIEAKAKGDAILSLNVNKYNKAIHFYEKVGFHLVGHEDIDIGEGYLMEDAIMEKNIG